MDQPLCVQSTWHIQGQVMARVQQHVHLHSCPLPERGPLATRRKYAIHPTPAQASPGSATTVATAQSADASTHVPCREGHFVGELLTARFPVVFHFANTA